MNNVIEMAKNHLVLSMQDILDTDMMEHTIKEFLETCLHDKFDNGSTVVHGETEIKVTSADDNIKISHAGTDVVIYHYGRGNVYVMPEKHYGKFRNTFGDFPDEEYVDEVINTLINILLENHFLYMV